MNSGTGRIAGRRALPGDEALLSATLHFLSICDRTHAQVQAFLDRRGVSQARARMVLARLRAWGYLDDETFALRWARGRIASRPMGRARLEAELAAKGFDAGTTARTLDAMYGDRREADMAEALLGRTSALRARSAAQQAALLRRHGFSEDTIEQVMGTDGSW